MFFSKKRAIIFVDEEKAEHVLAVCSDIAKKDKSFVFDTFGKNIILEHRNRDKLHKKALWIAKKVDGVRGYVIV